MVLNELILALVFDLIIIVALYIIYIKKKEIFEDLNHKLAYLALIITIVVAVPSYVSLTSEDSDDQVITAKIDENSLHNYRYEISNLVSQYNYKGALDIANQWIKSEPENGEAWAYRAEVLQKLGQDEEAYIALNKAEKLGYKPDPASLEKPKSKSTSINLQSALAGVEIPEGIEISDLAIETSSGNIKFFVGKVKNTSNCPISRIDIWFKLLDSSGAQLNEWSTSIDNLEPAMTAKFREFAEVEGIASIKISKIYRTPNTGPDGQPDQSC